MMVLIIFCVICFWHIGLCTSKRHCSTAEDELKAALNNAKPGEEVCLGNGKYYDLIIELKTNDISLTGEEGGKVILEGNSALRIRAARVTVSNLKFMAPLGKGRNRNRPTPIEFGYNAKYSTVFNCMIDNHSANIWVKVRGQNNVVHHCTFKDKPAPQLDENDGEVAASNIISVNAKGMKNNVIHHNRFINYDPDAKLARHKHGTAEAIFVKIHRTYGRETERLNCLVHNNYFFKIDGEEETIGIKSSGNEIFENAIESCYGGISLRHGRNNIVRGNFIRARPTNSHNNFGISVHDQDHIIKNNWLMDVGQFHGMKVQSGNGKLDCNACHVRAKDVLIKNNILINSVLYLGRKFSTGPYSEPENIKIDTITSSNSRLTSKGHSYAMIDGYDLATPEKFQGKPYTFSGRNQFYGPRLAYDKYKIYTSLKPLLKEGTIVWKKKPEDLENHGIEMIKKIKCAAGTSWEEKDKDCSIGDFAKNYITQ